jgi:hypothetical protein
MYTINQLTIVPSGKFMNIFNGHAAPVTAGQFTADGKYSDTRDFLSRNVG